MRIHSKNCHQCGILIAEQNPNLHADQGSFEITQISVRCVKGHKQPVEFED